MYISVNQEQNFSKDLEMCEITGTNDITTKKENKLSYLDAINKFGDLLLDEWRFINGHTSTSFHTLIYTILSNLVEK